MNALIFDLTIISPINFNSALNPFIFGFYNPVIQHGFRDLLLNSTNEDEQEEIAI